MNSTKKSLFKFDKSSHIAPQAAGSFKEHRRNASDVSNDENLAGLTGGSGKSATGYLHERQQQREKLLICKPDQSVITKVYLPLMGYIQEIESFMKCKPG